MAQRERNQHRHSTIARLKSVLVSRDLRGGCRSTNQRHCPTAIITDVDTMKASRTFDASSMKDQHGGGKEMKKIVIPECRKWQSLEAVVHFRYSGET